MRTTRPGFMQFLIEIFSFWEIEFVMRAGECLELGDGNWESCTSEKSCIRRCGGMDVYCRICLVRAPHNFFNAALSEHTIQEILYHDEKWCYYPLSIVVHSPDALFPYSQI